MSRWRTRHRGGHAERGAAAVEFAIVLVVLLLIIFAIIDFGRLFFVKQSVNAASREGARVASIDSATTTSALIFNRTATAANSAKGLAGGGNTSIGAYVCTADCATTPVFGPYWTAPGTPTTVVPTAPTDGPCFGNAYPTVRITVEQQFRWLTPVGGLLGGFFTPETVSGETTMRCE